MDLGLDGKVAVVTGGSSGIGLATVEGLLAEGATVAMIARGRARIDREIARLETLHPGRVLGVAADTSNQDDVDATLTTVVDLFGAPAILVNAAATPSLAVDMGEDHIEREIAVKVRGYLRCVRAVAPGMVEAGWGRIINVGGIAFRRSTSLVGSLRNAAVVAMTKALADELGPHGVNVTALHPGWTVTGSSLDLLERNAAERGTTADALRAELEDDVVIGRVVEAAEVASVIVFLASPRSVALAGDSVFATGGTKGATYY